MTGRTSWKEIKRKNLEKKIVDVEEVKLAAKRMEALAKAQADNAAAKMEALSPSYHRRMTASEINEISERVRQDNASKICHPIIPASEVKAGLKLSHGPCGGESTPPFGDVVHRGVDGAERVEPFGTRDSWAVNKKLNEITLHDEDAVGVWPDAPETEEIELTQEVVDTLCKQGIQALLDDEEEHEPVLTDYPLEAEAQDRSVREYFEAKDPVNPVHTYATKWAQLNTDKIDREILAQRDEMREQKAKDDLKAALNEYQEIVAEEGSEVYGRGILQGPRETFGFSDEKEDLVNSPTHYNQFGLECIDAIKLAVGEEGFIGYCHGNALKYLWRAEYKESKKTDFAKAAWYARMAGGDDPRDD